MTERRASALENLFYERFFYNDLISSHDDPQLTAANLMAILAFPGLLTLYWIPKYYVVLARAPESVRLWHGLGDRFVWIAFSMTVIALLSALQWESLLPDRRDMTILGPQPVTAAELFRAQGRALGRYLWLFFAILNAAALFFYPLGVVPWRASFLEGAWFALAHVVAVASAALFAFFAVAGVQALLLLVLSPTLFRRVSQWAQLVVAAALCGSLILLFVLRGAAFAGTSTVYEAVSNPAARWLPPMWFAGLGEWLTRGSSTCAPMAKLALIALAASALLTAAGYALSYRRFGALALETPTRPRLAQSRPVPRWDRLGLADPSQRAVFFFTLRTMLRSPLHRLKLGVFAGIGLAFVVIRAWDADPQAPGRELLEGPFALLFLCAVGLRAAFELPAELPANWAFRFHTDASRLQRYLAGARKAAWAGAFAPLVLLSTLAVDRLWGPTVSVPHGAGMLMVAWLALEAAQAGVRKIPFTCNFVAPRAHAIIVWTICAIAMAGFAASLASIELWALESPWRLWQASAWAALAGVLWLLWNERSLQELGGPEFFERPDEIQRLSLDG
ncbi:MAG: hypothetical protein H6509_16095 [Bryobacterales bacterium]|nr:hypothetical protein [Acidobacteriota bacterium]MCB9386133.1 hypothetical protein [Bryobacterales bacterium]